MLQSGKNGTTDDEWRDDFGWSSMVKKRSAGAGGSRWRIENQDRKTSGRRQDEDRNAESTGKRREGCDQKDINRVQHRKTCGRRERAGGAVVWMRDRNAAENSQDVRHIK